MNREEYEKCAEEQKPNTLPSFDEIKDFHLETIEESKNPLRDIAKKIAGHYEKYIDFIEALIHPEHTIIAMHESSAFGEKEREELTELLRKMMLRARMWLVCDIDAAYVVYIQDASKEWASLKPQIRNTLIRVTKSWEPKHEIKNIIEYLG